MQNVYSVKQVNAYIKNMFTQDFMLNHIYVKGEVSNCKYHTSGHIYFSLKDSSGTISCIMFAGQRKGLAFQMKDGQQVVALGSVSTYERDGKYQLYAKEIILDGAGLLYEKYETLKRELEEMGMFSSQYKRPIPFYAKTIGVVTAPTGAAIKDIMNVTARRNPYVQLILYPALVQGEGAKESIVKGIHMLEQKKVDLLIVGRGGGSIEDLWAFNEEEVARAIFACQIPVISAVGHETDTTIADYVADLRAPTPSAAAELAVVEYAKLAETAMDKSQTLYRQMNQKIQKSQQKWQQYQMKMQYLHPHNKLREQQQRAVEIEEKLRIQMAQRLERNRHRLAICMETMKGLSPIEKLNQGYSYVQSASGKVVKSIETVKREEILDIYVTDGTIQAKVVSKDKRSL
ncbi:MAG: exodeoxyribonuclease VII large subunit [Lachnospiraceae bacterium]